MTDTIKIDDTMTPKRRCVLDPGIDGLKCLGLTPKLFD